MIRGFLVLAGILIVATGRTPFDVAGVHISGNSLHEMVISVLVLVAALCATSD